MKIIIIGDGKVGYTLAENLSRDDDNDVTIIDKNAEVLRDTIDSLDVRCIKGNGVSANVLLDAGVREADLLVAATTSDEMNMVCCLTAKKLGARHTAARIRDPEYADELSQLRVDLELDIIINPEQAVAGEIVKLLGFPSAVKIETFAKGFVEMVEINVTPGMAIINMTLREISKRVYSHILIGAIARDGKVIIPNGDMKILKDDRIFVVGQPARVFHFCVRIGIHTTKIRDVMIVGGGRVAYYLAKYLAEIDVSTKIIERDRGRCQELAELLPDTLIIHGDGSDDKVLRSENVGDMDAFIAVTGMDEENLITALLAKRHGAANVVAKINRMFYVDVISDIGIDHIVSPKQVTSNYFLRFIRGLKNAMGNPVEMLYRIVDGLAEVIEFVAQPSAKLLDTPLRKLNLVEGVLVAILVRKNDIIIPHGNDFVKDGDRVILITSGLELSDLDDLLASG